MLAVVPCSPRSSSSSGWHECARGHIIIAFPVLAQVANKGLRPLWAKRLHRPLITPLLRIMLVSQTACLIKLAESSIGYAYRTTDDTTIIVPSLPAFGPPRPTAPSMYALAHASCAPHSPLPPSTTRPALWFNGSVLLTDGAVRRHSLGTSRSSHRLAQEHSP